MAEPEATQLLREAGNVLLDTIEGGAASHPARVVIARIDAYLSTTPAVEAMRRKTLEEAAAVCDERAEACRAAGIAEGIDPIEAQILDEHLSEAATAIRALIDPKEADCG